VKSITCAESISDFACKWNLAAQSTGSKEMIIKYYKATRHYELLQPSSQISHGILAVCVSEKVGNK
jgi:hypothetical protein